MPELNLEMNNKEFRINMSNGDLGAVLLVSELLTKKGGKEQMLDCFNKGIIGARFYRLYHEICDSNYQCFAETVEFFKSNIISDKFINKNFTLPHPIPYIDNSILPKEEEKELYFIKQGVNYLKRLKKQIIKQEEKYPKKIK